MIRPSFIPPRPLRELREFTRRRKQMIGLAAQERNRVQKILEDANVKIGDVLSDVFGLSGQLMLVALVEGQGDACDIAQLAQRGARKKIAELTAALEGHQMRDSHRTLIRHALRHMAFLSEEIDLLDRDIEKCIEAAGLNQAHQLLQSLPGIQATAAAAILAESGPDMKQFPNAAQFSSWPGLAPGNNESAGKRKRAPALKGNPHIKTAMVEAACSATHTKNSEFASRYQKLQPRLGHKRSLVAIAHLLVLRVYEVLSTESLSSSSGPSSQKLSPHHPSPHSKA